MRALAVLALVLMSVALQDVARADETDLVELGTPIVRGARVVSPGTIRIGMILAKFPSFPSEPFSPAAASALAFGAGDTLREYIEETSYGRNTVAGSTYGWVTLPHDVAFYCAATTPEGLGYECNLGQLVVDAIGAAATAGFAGGFDRLFFVVNGFGPVGYALGDSVLIGATTGFSIDTMGHELGHTMGAMHAGLIGCDNGMPDLDRVDVDCPPVRYGDTFDTMGSGAHHYSAYHKRLFGFLDPARIATAYTDGTFTLKPFELPSTGYQALYVPLDATRFYFFEYRQPIGFDALPAPFNPTPPEGVLVRLRNSSPTVDVDTMLLRPLLRPDTPAFVDPFHEVKVSVSAMTPDGVTITVDRGWDPTPASAWTVETADGSPRTGSFNAIAVDPSCNLHVAYVDVAGRTLRHAAQVAEDPWTPAVVDATAGRPGDHVSLAADASGTLHAAYYAKDSYRDLRYASRALGGSWTVETIDSAGAVGPHTSIAVAGDGTVHIAYQDYGLRDLRHAWRSPGGAWQVATIDAANQTGFRTAIAISLSGNVYVTYGDATTRRLKLGIRSPSSGTWTIEDVGPSTKRGNASAIAVDGSSMLHVAYYDPIQKNLQYARRTPLGVWTRETIDATARVGEELDLAVDPSGTPVVVAYTDARLRLLRMAMRQADGWSSDLIDGTAYGVAPSLALGCGANPGPQVSYFDRGYKILKHAAMARAYTVAPAPESQLILAGDLTGDGIVGFSERLRLGDFQNGATPTPAEMIRVDANRNGVFDDVDYATGVANAGSTARKAGCIRAAGETNQRFYFFGDLDQDGTVTTRELARVGNQVQGTAGFPEPHEVVLSDANGDGRFTMDDAKVAVNNHLEAGALPCIDLGQ